jgi:hypothetical protein
MFALGQPATSMAAPSKPTDTIMGGYTMIPQKFYHPNASRNALGLVGGNEVSVAAGNLVDVESDLRNITRDLSKAPTKQYRPSCPLGGAKECPAWPKQLVFTDRSSGKLVSVNTQPRHLPTSQMMSYPGVPAPEPFIQEVYGSPWRF